MCACRLVSVPCERREMALVLRQLVAVVPNDFIDMNNPYGWHPLHILSSGKDNNGIRAGMVRTMATAGCMIEPTKKRGMTPLMVAVSTGHLSVADELVLQGADPYRTNTDGSSAYNQAWHNTAMRRWAQSLGIQRGNEVLGDGRLLNYMFPKIHVCCLQDPLV